MSGLKVGAGWWIGWLVVASASTGCAAKARPQTSPAGSIRADAEQAGGLTEDQLRADLMSFADRFAAQSVQGLVHLEQREATKAVRFVTMSHRVYTLTAEYELAIAPNVSVGLLDMMALTMLTRLVWEDHWRDEVFGDAAQPMVDAMIELENDLWRIGGKVLTEPQRDELRSIVQSWHDAHPDVFTVSHVRLGDIGRGDVALLARAEQPGGLLGVKRAVSALNDTQQLLERTLWFLTRLQLIARFQAELTFMQLATSPEMEQVFQELDEIVSVLPTLPADIAERSLTVSHELLGQITVEREAAINQILGGLADERRQTLAAIASPDGPRAAVADVRTTIEATNELVRSVDALLVRLEPVLSKGEPAPAAPPARPFDINEYRDTVAEATRTIERLNDLVVSIDGVLASPAVSEGLPRLQAEGQTLVRSLFRAGLTLIAITLFGLLFVLVAYRWVSIRLPRPAR